MRRIGWLWMVLIFMSCVEKQLQRTDWEIPMYPDYKNVSIPVNLAPLNFMLRDSACGIKVYADGCLIGKSNDRCLMFDEDDWKEFMQSHKGKKVEIRVLAEYEDVWNEYAPFEWYIAEDSIDSYLTYRLIEPDYEVFNRLQLQERCLENFKCRNFCDYERVGNRCMNCHTYNQQNPNHSMMYVRGEGGGAVLNSNGKLSLLDINAEGMVSGSVYFGLHPNGRHVVFSSNVIIPAFHSAGSKRLEVFDTKSDVYVADLSTNVIYSTPLLNDSAYLETFPTFSPDGKSIYYCTAKTIDDFDDIKNSQYMLCRISFDEDSVKFGNKVDTFHQAGTSICHPRISPDGRYLLYTKQDYGTFPIWHRETDLQLLDLKTGAIDSLKIVNSDRSDTYHSWSSNGRWFVFASKRDDGLYGKPYFCYMDSDGEVHKPFVLPQKYPEFYDNNLKSFNIPELGTAPLPFNAEDVKDLLEKGLRKKFVLK